MPVAVAGMAAGLGCGGGALLSVSPYVSVSSSACASSALCRANPNSKYLPI